MNINSTTSSTSSTDYSRITGLATGLDIEGLVKAAMSGDQAKIDKAKQDQQYLQWQQEAYVGVIKDLKDFYNSYLDILAPSDTNMMSSSNYNGLKATVSSENGGDNKLSVATLPGAIKGTYSVKIDQLAAGAKAQSSVLDLTKTINSGSVTITVGDGSKTNTFTITPKAGDDIGDLINSLKNAKDASGNSILNFVNINYSEITKKLTIETKNTGSSQTLSITDTTDSSALGTLTSTAATDAIVEIKAPGESDYAPAYTRPSNSFTIDNLKFDLQGTTIDSITPNDYTDDNPAIFTVKDDASDSVAKIKKFVDAYNTLIDKLNSEVKEKKSYDYKPLTDAQKSAMKDTEITAWEAKAKEGILSNESNITNLLYGMRQAIYKEVSGTGISLADIGITTVSYFSDGGKIGKLQIDEDKLTNALENRADQVKNLFTQSGTDDDSKGILKRFSDLFDANIGLDGTLIKKAGYKNTRWVVSNDLTKNIQEKTKLILNLQEMFNEKQQNYYNMFATLETNMNNLNSQSSWLMSQLG